MSHLHRNRSQAIDDFFHALLSLKDLDECYLFFSDLCTVQELSSMALRLEAAKLLAEGHTYKTVQERIKISSSTITRINTELCYGAGGYRLVVDRLKDFEEQDDGKEQDAGKAHSLDVKSDKTGKTAKSAKVSAKSPLPPKN